MKSDLKKTTMEDMENFMNNKFRGYTNAEKALQMIIDLTGDLGGGNSLSEKLQRLLDLPCECCNDGETIKTLQNKLDRLSVLLYNSLAALEEQTTESIIGTDLEDKIGITSDEYDEIMGRNDVGGLNTKYDIKHFRYDIVIECLKSGVEYFDESEPTSQQWKDIVAKYNSEKQKLIDEIQENLDVDATCEWTLNGYQPIIRFKCNNGDWYEIYVRASKK